MTDNTEISKIFEMKLQVSDTIRKYVSAKVNHAMKNFENRLADELIVRFLNDLENQTEKIISKIEKEK